MAGRSFEYLLSAKDTASAVVDRTCGFVESRMARAQANLARSINAGVVDPRALAQMDQAVGQRDTEAVRKSVSQSIQEMDREAAAAEALKEQEAAAAEASAQRDTEAIRRHVSSAIEEMEREAAAKNAQLAQEAQAQEATAARTQGLRNALGGLEGTPTQTRLAQVAQWQARERAMSKDNAEQLVLIDKIAAEKRLKIYITEEQEKTAAAKSGTRQREQVEGGEGLFGGGSRHMVKHDLRFAAMNFAGMQGGEAGMLVGPLMGMSLAGGAAALALMGVAEACKTMSERSKEVGDAESHQVDMLNKFRDFWDSLEQGPTSARGGRIREHISQTAEDEERYRDEKNKQNTHSGLTNKVYDLVMDPINMQSDHLRRVQGMNEDLYAREMQISTDRLKAEQVQFDAEEKRRKASEEDRKKVEEFERNKKAQAEREKGIQDAQDADERAQLALKFKGYELEKALLDQKHSIELRGLDLLKDREKGEAMLSRHKAEDEAMEAKRKESVENTMHGLNRRMDEASGNDATKRRLKDLDELAELNRRMRAEGADQDEVTKVDNLLFAVQAKERAKELEDRQKAASDEVRQRLDNYHGADTVESRFLTQAPGADPVVEQMRLQLAQATRAADSSADMAKYIQQLVTMIGSN